MTVFSDRLSFDHLAEKAEMILTYQARDGHGFCAMALVKSERGFHVQNFFFETREEGYEAGEPLTQPTQDRVYGLLQLRNRWHREIDNYLEDYQGVRIS